MDTKAILALLVRLEDHIASLRAIPEADLSLDHLLRSAHAALRSAWWRLSDADTAGVDRADANVFVNDVFLACAGAIGAIGRHARLRGYTDVVAWACDSMARLIQDGVNL